MNASPGAATPAPSFTVRPAYLAAARAAGPARVEYAHPALLEDPRRLPSEKHAISQAVSAADRGPASIRRIRRPRATRAMCPLPLAFPPGPETAPGGTPQPAEALLKTVRQLIESVNDTLKGRLDPEQHGARTIGAPVTRSLIAYDH